MIVLTQVIYLKPGQEDVFNEFESIALPAMEKYQGKLLMRIRPTAEQFIEGSMAPPHEIHLVSFPKEEDLMAFLQDKQRQEYLHLKEQSIETSLIYKGVQFP